MNNNQDRFPARSPATTRRSVRQPGRPAPRLLALGIACALAALASTTALAAPPASGDFARGRILVMPRAGLPDADLGKLLAPHGGKARRVGQSDLHIVDLPANASETAIVNLLARHPHLRFAELDRAVAPNFAATDPYTGSQWHLASINAPAAWDVSQGAGVTIAILDSGVMTTHPDLAASIVAGYNSFDGSTAVSDVQGHGTAVAGAAAAITNNALGVAGIAGAARIMPIRISDAAGTAYYSTIASGVTWAADHGARVANCSYGYLFSSAAVQSAGQYLKSKGGLLVVSAGNNGVNENAPATASMITVSATDGANNMAGWSSYGDMVSVAAPGVGIWTTSSDGTYRSASGTSFAAPITAGVVGLIMAANPALTSAQVESVLFSTATDLGAAGRDLYYGNGLVNADAAVRAARGTVAADTQPPSVAIATPAGGATVSGMASIDVNASDNVGVTKVDLRVNGITVASSSVAPFHFAVDTVALANGMNNLVAYAYDAAGNGKASTAVAVNVANNVVADTAPPTVAFSNPRAGQAVSGTLQVSVGASDNSGAAGIRQSLYLDGALVASASGATLNYSWNTRKARAGVHTLMAVAQDAAGNKTSSSVQVSK